VVVTHFDHYLTYPILPTGRRGLAGFDGFERSFPPPASLIEGTALLRSLASAPLRVLGLCGPPLFCGPLLLSRFLNFSGGLPRHLHRITSFF
jgi:hypothetical protein